MQIRHRRRTKKSSTDALIALQITKEFKKRCDAFPQKNSSVHDAITADIYDSINGERPANRRPVGGGGITKYHVTHKLEMRRNCYYKLTYALYIT